MQKPRRFRFKQELLTGRSISKSTDLTKPRPKTKICGWGCYFPDTRCSLVIPDLQYQGRAKTTMYAGTVSKTAIQAMEEAGLILFFEDEEEVIESTESELLNEFYNTRLGEPFNPSGVGEILDKLHEDSVADKLPVLREGFLDQI